MNDEKFMRQAIELSMSAVAHGMNRLVQCL